MTAPEPTVCPTCKGDRAVRGEPRPSTTVRPCPECCCDRCGTDVYTRGDGPQLCNDCAENLGDRAYERGQDA